MAEWQRVAAVADIPIGTGKEIAVSGRLVALFNIDGTFRAIDGICAHQGGPLGKGTVVGNVVTCPWHGWQFDVAAGTHCLNSRICQTVFEAKVEEDSVFVRL